jgi:hypothetical protein
MQEANSQRFAVFAKSLLCSLSVVIITFLASSAFAQKEDSSISWLASGDSTTNFTIENLGFSMTLEGLPPGGCFSSIKEPIYKSIHRLAFDQPRFFW